MLVGYARTSTVDQQAGFEAQSAISRHLDAKKSFRSRFQALRSAKN